MTEQDKKDIQDALDIIQKSLDEETIDGESLFTDEVKLCAYKDYCKYTRRAYNKAIDDFINTSKIEISESHIWNLIVCRTTKDASDLSDKLVDYFIEIMNSTKNKIIQEKNSDEFICPDDSWDEITKQELLVEKLKAGASNE